MERGVSSGGSGDDQGVEGGDGRSGDNDPVRKNDARGDNAHISFRDKLLGGKVHPQIVLPGDLVANKLAKVECLAGDRLSPVVSFDPTVIHALSMPWKDALVIKLLGKTLSYPMIKQKLKNLWRLSGGYDVMNVGNGYFLVKFDSQEDRMRVITEGPWMIQDHYLAVKQWSPSFNPGDSCFGHTMVWIRLSGLNVLY